MTIYFSTFISGFNSLILELIKKDIKDVKNIKIFDGAVVYESNSDIESIKKIRYFNNSFIVIKEFKYNSTPNIVVLDRIINELLNGQNNFNIPTIPMKTFKIFFSLENTLVKPDGKLMYHLVELLEEKTKKNIILILLILNFGFCIEVKWWVFLCSE